MFFCWFFFPPTTCVPIKVVDKEKEDGKIDGDGMIKANPVFNPEDGLNPVTLEVHAMS